jgi:cyclic beta-1,2-glucan synthetase
VNQTLRRPASTLTSTRLARFRARFRPRLPIGPEARNEQPLRSELFSADQMEQHGLALAAAHTSDVRRAPDQLLPRLAENEQVLCAARDLLAEAVPAHRRTAPGGEWLLDNFYLIEDQIRTARSHLSRDYSRELPRLLTGPSAGLPRVYDLALQTVAHGDGRVDMASFGRFVTAYQTVQPLTLGELWAVPIMLRLALLENLRRVSVRLAADLVQRNEADDWADRMIETAQTDPKSLILVIADMARSNPPMVSPFVAELARRLQGQSSALALPLTWMEQHLAEGGQTIEQLVRSENQQLAGDQVSISNSIGSLRVLEAMDWRGFVETMSVVEQALREDPEGTYGRMDFATRDRYRHVVERLGRRGRLSEGDVARSATRLAREAAAAEGPGSRAAHVGYFLIDEGRDRLERLAAVRAPAFGPVTRAAGARPLLVYLGAITCVTAVVAWCLTAQVQTDALRTPAVVSLALFSTVAASQLAVALVNWLVTLLVVPRPLPRMDFSDGIPAECRAMVVVPALLTSVENVEALVEALEVRFLANRDDNLRFALLTDFRDAQEETTPGDEPLLRMASSQIAELNEKYAGVQPTPFFLFHRARRWNPHERVWMGYERKRGKLADLNALLRKGSSEAFSHVVGDLSNASGVKYVITLDADTQLPRDAARACVGAMAHPLNRPRYDPRKQRVSAGYGILQPRVAASLPGSNRSRYARLNGSQPGIDPYTRAVSDVYQDLFGEGSFIGKGIYDIDAFEQALSGRFPENQVLSHDLLEGSYARAGLLSDVLLYEEHPSHYGADVSRRHRWIRGDWQLVRWLLPRTPGLDGRRQKNPLSTLSRWKLLDNLRRSLVPAALMLLLLLGWTAPSPAWLWTLSVVGVVLIPSLMASAVGAVRKPRDLLFAQHLVVVARAAREHAGQAVLQVACLPYEAWFTLGAITRTVLRMLVTRRPLLEWSQSSDRNGRAALAGEFRSMWVAPAVGVGAVICLAWFNVRALVSAWPILGLWLVAPALTWWTGRPLVSRAPALTAKQLLFLRGLSRKTWAFFETFAGEDDHWLPPDNYQEQPGPIVAHRTSPTNMGLALLANLSAYDFGYLSAGGLLERTTRALDSMEGLERYRGHFYNWYDTQSLKPLVPLYVSTVDSGNLAAHLLTLRAGLLALPDDPILSRRVVDGLEDTIAIVLDGDGVADDRTPLLRRATAGLRRAPRDPHATRETLLALSGVVSSGDAGPEGAPDVADPGGRRSWWPRALDRQCRDVLNELTLFLPWAELPALRERVGSLTGLSPTPTLRELARFDESLLTSIDTALGEATPEERGDLTELRGRIPEACARARERIATVERLAAQCTDMAAMEYGFLYDRARHLLAIGYNVGEHRRDASYYDLLASEARLSTFVAIAQGQLPQESWFALGRLLTIAAGEPTLVSWSGSMFEYLMPLLVMPSCENTLLDQTCHQAVRRQIEYGRARAVPWGISESGYNALDASLSYQYRAFGVPGLGLKRGLAGDLVVAPYASALALTVEPEAACANLQRLAGAGGGGEFGFYEAIDYTPSRVPSGQSSAVVRSFMAHHEGMTLLALSHLLLRAPLPARFESDPRVQATVLLLHERIPRARATYSPAPELSGGPRAGVQDTGVRVLTSPNTAVPEVQLLSNGRYHVMVSNAGGGYSRWVELAVTRWREDPTADAWGTFCYLRDAASGRFWSAAYQPTRRRVEAFEAIFSEGRAEFRGRYDGVETHTEIVVSPEDDIELRRVHLTNRSATRRMIDVTSYAEVVLAPPAADVLHPAFSNLFVQTEIVGDQHAILCTRRPRSRDEEAPWMFHLMTVHGTEAGEASYETDRARFIGRCRSVADPQAMADASLSDSHGSVLDPIVAIRRTVALEPDGTATVDIVTGAADARETCVALIGKYQDRRMANRVFALTSTHSQVTLRQLNATEADAQLYSRLAGSIIYPNASLRADPGLLLRNRRGQSGLWAYAISGDLPIVLLQIGDRDNIELVRQLVQAHAYWRLKGLAVDLVIWNEDQAGYRQVLQENILGLVAAGIESNVAGRTGGAIFVRPAEQIAAEDRVLFQSVARVTISDARGILTEQVKPEVVKPAVARLVPTRPRATAAAAPAVRPRTDLLFFNGLGGFTRDGREYVVTVAPGQVTPAPWVNVLANRHLGTVISQSGCACTWSENAHEFRLTPWHNDPVTESSGEALYLRDDESGEFWCPTPMPTAGDSPFVIRHGFGYSVFEHSENGIATELWVYVALDAPVRFSVLKVRNDSGRSRRLSATAYVEWVLGDLRSKSSMHIVTEVDPASGALFARNPYNSEFAGRIGWLDTDDPARTVTGDRTEFLGRNGTPSDPAAMARTHLSGRVGAALDPCGAVQVPFVLADGQARDIVFRIGAGRDAEDAGRLVHRFRGSTAARDELEQVWSSWNRTVGAVRVETPDPALDVLANGWLVYQTLASRLRARSGFYQPGGAFGFRDQLQDVMALVHSEPQLARDQLLLCASRQFIDGDVQHWWHPPSGRGVRTHCSDDYLWLPLCTCRYVLVTGDTGVLDERVHFLEGRSVNADEDSYYDLPARSQEAATLFDHCVRSITRAVQRVGVHGLPLMGSGDWNDGMNVVGEHGRGESVWLAFFLHTVLRQFEDVARLHSDPTFAERCSHEAEQLRGNVEDHGWDGAWYRRAYFDDGTPLGSESNAECQIDSIPQSWSVLSGAGDVERSRAAMDAVDERLVSREDRLVRLLAPPFDTSDLNPGYIRGYVPGVRENGGQYTHAAVWAAMAFAELGNSRLAWEVFDLINPVTHAMTAEAAATYKVEPYVVAADVYAVGPHVGRGGWTWYTGSAAWLYRLIIESLLGLTREGETLRIVPCLPADWRGFTVHYLYRETMHHIAVTQSRGAAAATTVSVDGVGQDGDTIRLVDDRRDHAVAVNICRRGD